MVCNVQQWYAVQECDANEVEQRNLAGNKKYNNGN